MIYKWTKLIYRLEQSAGEHSGILIDVGSTRLFKLPGGDLSVGAVPLECIRWTKVHVGLKLYASWNPPGLILWRSIGEEFVRREQLLQ